MKSQLVGGILPDGRLCLFCLSPRFISFFFFVPFFPLFIRNAQMQKDSGVAGGHKRGVDAAGAGGQQKKNSLFQLEALTERLQNM